MIVTVEKPSLHPMAESAIAELKRLGVEQLDPDEVIWLQEAAKETTKVDLLSIEDWLEIELEVEGYVLHSLSPGAWSWLRNVAYQVTDEEASRLMVLLFAMQHSHDAFTFRSYWSLEKVQKLVAKMLDETKSSMELIRRAVQHVLRTTGDEVLYDLDIPSKVEHNKIRSTWGNVIALLMHYYPGQTPEYWCWGVSEEKIVELLQAIPLVRRDQDYSKRLLERQVPDIAKFNAIKREIIRRHKEKETSDAEGSQDKV